MKRSLPAILTLILLISTFLVPASILGQSIESPDGASNDLEDDAPVQRVARLSLVEGDVSFLRAGVTEWAAAVENLPLLTGDQIYAGDNARAEIQLGRGNYVRLSANTAITISDLSHTAAQLEITEGIAIIRLERFGVAFDRFEVDTPNAALLLEKDGLYRVNVRGDQSSEIIARRGSAEVTTDDGSFKVREGYRLMVDTTSRGRLELALDTSSDDWDRWSYDRDTYIDTVAASAAPDYVSQYETDYNCFYGASELANYGHWTNVSSYGNCWIPRVGSGWAPYRHGQWLWIPSVGWSWYSSEPWGWAPYHYGRWAHISGIGWAWVPGFGSRYRTYGHSYYQWRPALVYFFNCPTPRGDYVAWYPLAPGERWRRPGSYGRGGDHSHLQYPSPRDGRRRPGDEQAAKGRLTDRHGVTILPVEGFNRPDRGTYRPEAPGRDTDRWAYRPGLPDVKPTYAAAAPVWRTGDGPSKFRRVVKPPVEIIKRPIVTRIQPTDPQVGAAAPRERRLVISRRPENADGSVVLKEKRTRHDHGLPADTNAGAEGKQQEPDAKDRDGSEYKRRPGPIQLDRPDGGRHVRRQDQEGQGQVDAEENSSRRGAKDRSGESEDGGLKRVKERPQIILVPKSDGDQKSDGQKPDEKPRGNEDDNRGKRQISPDRQQRDSRPDEGETTKRRDSADSASRPAEPKPEHKNEDRQERRQEKEERRQERQDDGAQRKKGKDNLK